ncbi:MAG: F0F1 ATP synthase subunit B [Peptococcaceae bacterium]|jgi:F-type H+-transporting ATPase subunit b|nr:F0F1 ATP synthase subunit B [Peptococcaceae bacterium]
MLDIDFTFLFTGLNLIVLYLFLRKFLFRRVGDYMENRSRLIAEDIQKGAELKAEGEDFRARQEEALTAAAAECQSMLRTSREEAARRGDEIVAEAKKEATRLVTRAREEAQRERERLLADLRLEVASLALAAATKVVEENMDNERNRRLIEEFLDREGAA